jgi:hypothetical protein
MVMALLIGIILGAFIGSIVTIAWHDSFEKFCPECGHYYNVEEEYCSYDGSELKMMGDNI